jgi:hypothetical protein
MKGPVTFIILFCLLTVHIFSTEVFALGNRGSYTRGGFCGAKYIALGNAGEADADDVYSIYWNPAGLVSLVGADVKSPDEIRTKAEKGDVTGLTDKDLEQYGSSQKDSSLHFGVSGSSISIDRTAAFGGVAFAYDTGAFGAGVYSLYSGGIEEYDTNGNKTGTGVYNGTEAFLSYAHSIDKSSIGFSLKGLHETISDASFAGAAVDIGVKASPLPFMKIGFVAQDLGIGLYPVSGKDLEKKYDTGSPTLRSSVLFESRSAGVTLAAGAVRHIEQKTFLYTAGIRYVPTRKVLLSLGFFDKNFSVGAGLKVWKMELWYAFSYDRIGMGYNNSVSLAAAL